MSRDVIKRDDFREMFEAGALAPDAPGAGAQRYTSPRVRFRELLDHLEESDARERREVARAAAAAREEALAEARAEYDGAVQAFRTAAAELRDAVNREVELAESELVELAAAIASKIVRREIRGDDDYLVGLVRRCLSRILRPTAVRIRLHPRDQERVADAAASLTGETEARHQLAFEADPRVERGGCVVETPDFVVDARRATQLAAATAAVGGQP